jgi:hypothetical protein
MHGHELPETAPIPCVTQSEMIAIPDRAHIGSHFGAFSITDAVA